MSIDDMPPRKQPRAIPTGDPYFDVPLGVDCPSCSTGKRGAWCSLAGGATWSMCGSRVKLAAAVRESNRRIRCAYHFLLTSQQTAVQREAPLVAVQLVNDAMRALRGVYPDWVTEEWHLDMERDALAVAAKLVELAVNPSVKVSLEVPDDQPPFPTVTYTDHAGKQHTMKGGRKI